MSLRTTRHASLVTVLRRTTQILGRSLSFSKTKTDSETPRLSVGLYARYQYPSLDVGSTSRKACFLRRSAIEPNGKDNGMNTLFSFVLPRPVLVGQKISYNFSADFPKLWCEANIRGSRSDRNTQCRRKRRSSATKRVANVYLRFISSWQARSRAIYYFGRFH